MDRDHRINGRRNELHYANTSGEMKRELDESSDIRIDRQNSNYSSNNHEERRRHGSASNTHEDRHRHGSASNSHEDKHRHGAAASSGRSEQRKSTSKASGQEFVLKTNRFSREKLSRGAVAPGSGLKEFLENNRACMRKSVWEKKITPRSNSQHDNQSHSRSMLDSRLNKHDKQDIRYISPSGYNEHQRRGSLDTRIMDLESGRRISVGSPGVPEQSHVNTRHKMDDGYYTGDNREEVPMDIGSEDEDHKHTPVSEENMKRRDRHASSEINHNYLKNKYNLNLEPLPVIKSENVKLEIKEEDGYINIPHSKGSWSPTRLPRMGTLENYNYERSVTPPRRPTNEFSENLPRRSHGSRENSPNRSREFSGNMPRRSHESRENSPSRSRELETVENSEDNHIPMPPENVVRNMNEAIPMSWHCQIYLSGLKCHKGDYCDKLHKYPRENGVVCIDFKSGQCNRKADDCWFQHPGQVAKEKEDDDSAPVVVQSMGGLMKYIKKEVSVEPNKYKSKDKPKKMSPPKGRSVNANMLPLGSRNERNANLTPLGSRNESAIEGSRKERNANLTPLGSRNESAIDNYSPLQPRKSTTSSSSYDSNPSQQESNSILSPRSKSSNNPLSHIHKSPLDIINNKPSTSTENILSNNTDEEKVQSSTQEKDLSKTKYQFIKNPPTTVNEVEDDSKRKNKKKKRDNSEENNADHNDNAKKSKKSKSMNERNCESEGTTVDSSRSDKNREKEKNKFDKKGLYKAIDEVLDKAATGGGKWKKSSDPEGDIKTLLEELDITIYSKGDKYKNLEVNFRQLYLKFAKVDDDLKEHALWFRKKFTDFANLPKDHCDDISCCNFD